MVSEAAKNFKLFEGTRVLQVARSISSYRLQRFRVFTLLI
jgi:hypothetical protein